VYGAHLMTLKRIGSQSKPASVSSAKLAAKKKLAARPRGTGKKTAKPATGFPRTTWENPTALAKQIDRSKQATSKHPRVDHAKPDHGHKPARPPIAMKYGVPRPPERPPIAMRYGVPRPPAPPPIAMRYGVPRPPAPPPIAMRYGVPRPPEQPPIAMRYGVPRPPPKK
jgi:hypothetical protein